MKKVLTEKNIGAGYLYFYVHFITEIICFYLLYRIKGNSYLLWIIPFVYDALAFVPQSIFGYFNDKYPKINLGILGVVIITLALQYILYYIHHI